MFFMQQLLDRPPKLFFKGPATLLEDGNRIDVTVFLFQTLVILAENSRGKAKLRVRQVSPIHPGFRVDALDAAPPFTSPVRAARKKKADAEGQPPAAKVAVAGMPGSVLLLLYTFFIVWTVGGLMCYHWYLALIGQTTNQQVLVACTEHVNRPG
eukprot:TRINITY_DN3520_c0_g1_i7.p1 TRINITY_DN3520_c0_g1~~TRINITY_DN3520_c0_g1_i7.p1  ORF type:complete len:154 (-),score=36.73 TRINITY_DN3520_c0_g1_i7:821-1282(-)